MAREPVVERYEGRWLRLHNGTRTAWEVFDAEPYDMRLPADSTRWGCALLWPIYRSPRSAARRRIRKLNTAESPTALRCRTLTLVYLLATMAWATLGAWFPPEFAGAGVFALATAAAYWLHVEARRAAGEFRRGGFVAPFVTPVSYVHGRDTAEPLAKRQVDEPVVGWKRARLVVTNTGEVRFVGVGVLAAYDAQATAYCMNIASHDAPVAYCGCGFHAVRSQDLLHKAAAEYGGSVADLEVWLWGRVMSHRDGWRAEHQQVVGVRLDARCWGPTSTCTNRPVVMAEFADVLHPFCGLHRPSGARTFTPADLSNLLGVEVAWRKEVT